MTWNVTTLKDQKKQQFAALFECVFPDGVNTEKLRTMSDYRRAVRAQIFRFACNEKFYIHCRCELCEQDNYFAVWDIAETLAMNRPLDCCCRQGYFVPVYREVTAARQAG